MPSPATQSPSAPSASTTGHGVEIASDSILGTTVRDAQGKDIGSVSKLMIDPAQGKVMSVIIKRGGTLGIGGKELAVPWSAVQIKRDQNQNMVVTLQQPLLEEAPARQDGRKDNGRDRSPSASPKSDDDKRNDKK
jgi:sporulation protein YlmC with PRC-barrel domain